MSQIDIQRSSFLQLQHSLLNILVVGALKISQKVVRKHCRLYFYFNGTYPAPCSICSSACLHLTLAADRNTTVLIDFMVEQTHGQEGHPLCMCVSSFCSKKRICFIHRFVEKHLDLAACVYSVLFL